MRSISARRKSIRIFGSITILNGVAAWSGLARLRLLKLFLSAATIWKSRFFSIPGLNHSSGERSIVDLTTDRPSLKENRNDQDGDDVHDFDHRIDRWPGGVFVGIAHRVARHRRCVRERTFAAEVSFLDKFLRVVPRAAAAGHGNGHKQTGDNCSDQKTVEHDR